MASDTLGAVLDDAAEVFRFVKDDRPQERAHAYLVRHEVRRGFNDTAMQCAVEDMVRRAHAVGAAEGKAAATGGGQPTETVDSPEWYEGGVETIAKIEAVVDGLPAREAYLLGQVIRYCDRAGKKDEADIDLGKANNYAHRLVSGEWRDHG